MSLYQNVRPDTLDGVAGNKPAVAILRNALAAADPPHVFLFSGPSGCGKTTMARIMARGLGCDVRTGGSMDYVEYNASEMRGIDVVRQIIQDSQFEPMTGNRRCILIDECHALTKDAMNAFLKPLEDYPKYQFYLLCTTDPGKLLKTILTRCVHVAVQPLSEDVLYNLLIDAEERAGLPQTAESVLEAIVRRAAGCPRSALNMLEQQSGMAEDQAIKCVDAFRTSEEQVIDLCRMLVAGKPWGQLAALYAKVEDKDPEGVRRAMLGYLKSCLLKSATADKAGRFARMIEELSGDTFASGEAGLLAMLYRATEVS